VHSQMLVEKNGGVNLANIQARRVVDGWIYEYKHGVELVAAVHVRDVYV